MQKKLFHNDLIHKSTNIVVNCIDYKLKLKSMLKGDIDLQ